jgi:hypothetical protein
LLGAVPGRRRRVFLYDKGESCLGYAVNLDWPDGSDWGYAPIGE